MNVVENAEHREGISQGRQQPLHAAARGARRSHCRPEKVIAAPDKALSVVNNLLWHRRVDILIGKLSIIESTAKLNP